MLTFNDILNHCGIDPNEVAVILHTPKEGSLRKALPRLVSKRPGLFAAYQATHSHRATATLRRRPFVASFVDAGDRTLLLAAYYRNGGARDRSWKEIGEDPAVLALVSEYGAYSEVKAGKAGSTPWFTFHPDRALDDFVGKLRIMLDLTPTYVRLAENLNAKVLAIERENAFDALPPDWRDIMPMGPEMPYLPDSWKALLRQTAGIYLIVDQSDGKRYVGSASSDSKFNGETNLLGRWLEHVKGQKGITAELKHRLTKDFRFSILQLTPDLVGEELIRIERKWMERLDTIKHGLNS